MKSRFRNAFTLIEILIVVVIMAILAATIIPQFTNSTDDAEVATTEFNLNTLRAQIELFKAQHGGAVPVHSGTTITELVTVTTYNTKSFGPYMVSVPVNSLTGNAAVKAVSGTTGIVAGDVTTGDTGGWIYHTVTGEIRIDHSLHVTK